MKTASLNEVAEFINGYAFKPSDWTGTGKKIIRIQNLTNQSKKFNKTLTIVPQKYHVKKGDILVSWSATLGVFEWQDEEEGLLNQHIFKVIPKQDKLEPAYFKHALNYSIDQMLKFTHGSTMKHIVRGDFLKQRIPLPPVSEQAQISKEINSILDLIEVRKNSLRLTEEYLKSLFFTMFGDPVTNTKQWETKLLGDLLESMTSGSRGWAKYFSDKGNSIFLTIKNVGRDGNLHLENITHVNAPLNAESKRTKVRENDVLMSITADLGRTAVVPKLAQDAFINQHLVILRLKQALNSIYISHFLSSPGGQIQIQSKNRGAAKAGLNFNDIRSIKVAIPPIKLQDKYAFAVKDIGVLKQRMDSQLDEINSFYRTKLGKYFSNL